MNRITDKELVLLEAEELELTLSDSDVDLVLKAWRDRPTCTIRDLLTGIRNLNEPERQRRLKSFALSMKGNKKG